MGSTAQERGKDATAGVVRRWRAPEPDRARGAAIRVLDPWCTRGQQG